MRLVDQPVENRVPKGGVADALMPVVERQLTGDEGGAAAVAVFEDLEQVAPFAVGEGREAPIIHEQELGLGEGEQLAVRPVGTREPEVV